jgi:hypothetical protein
MVCSTGPLRSRPYTIPPIVVIGEIAARPTNDRRTHFAHSVDERLAYPLDVRDLRVLSDPRAIVNRGSQVLEQISIAIGRDRAERLIEDHIYTRLTGGVDRRNLTMSSRLIGVSMCVQNALPDLRSKVDAFSRRPKARAPRISAGAKPAKLTTHSDYAARSAASRYTD